VLASLVAPRYLSPFISQEPSCQTRSFAAPAATHTASGVVLRDIIDSQGWAAFLTDVMRRPPPPPAYAPVGSRSSAKAAPSYKLPPPPPPPPPPLSDAAFTEQVTELVAKIRAFSEPAAAAEAKLP
jgi:hypothetical protein